MLHPLPLPLLSLPITRGRHPSELGLHERIPTRGASLLRVQARQARAGRVDKCSRRRVLRGDAEVACVAEGVHSVARFEEGGEARFVGGLHLLLLLQLLLLLLWGRSKGGLLGELWLVLVE